MVKVVDYNPKLHHKMCDKCHSIIEFSNEDIYRGDFGLEITCPNCGNDIKF